MLYLAYSIIFLKLLCDSDQEDKPCNVQIGIQVNSSEKDFDAKWTEWLSMCNL